MNELTLFFLGIPMMLISTFATIAILLNSIVKKSTINHRYIKIEAIAIALMFFIGFGLTIFQLKKTSAANSSYILSEESVAALRNGDSNMALHLALEALSEGRLYTDLTSTAPAQRALTNALGVYDLIDGYRPLYSRTISASAPVRADFSPDGTRIILLTMDSLMGIDTASGELFLINTVDSPNTTDYVFTNNNSLVFSASGKICAYNFNSKSIIWTSNVDVARICVAPNGTIGVGVSIDGRRVFIFNIESGDVINTLEFDDTSLVISTDYLGGILSLNKTGDKLALSFTNGTLQVFKLDYNEFDDTLNAEIEFSEAVTNDVSQCIYGGIYEDYLAYVIHENLEYRFTTMNLNDYQVMLSSSLTTADTLNISVNDDGIYMSLENLIVLLNPITFIQQEVAYTSSNVSTFTVNPDYTLVLSSQGEVLVFDKHSQKIAELNHEYTVDTFGISQDYIFLISLDQSEIHVFRKVSFDEYNVMTYDSSYPHIEARLNSDRTCAVLFGIDEFAVYKDDSLIIRSEIPDSYNVFDLQYYRSDNSLSVYYNDGLVRSYDVSTGSILSETYEEEINTALNQEFITKDYCVRTSTDGTAQIYDNHGLNLLTTISNNAYISCVYQIDDSLLIDYFSASGERYGLLMDSDFNIIAELPQLCDCFPDGTLIFDDNVGHLRASKLYTLPELINMGREKLQ